MTRITADWVSAGPVQQVCRMLTDAGHQAWFVGGCVRNALIGAPVSDIDLSTDAHPDLTATLATAAGLKAVPTGIDHGTVTVVADGQPFEITTFRKDVETDGRRAIVAYADNMADDARRRDFTMNALYADPLGNVADPLGGLVDLLARRVRFIENPDQRIREDYLRILRFFRFHAWYGDPDTGIDADGLAACAANVEGIATLSRERIGQEMVKLLSAPDPAPAVASLAACGGLAQVLPGADAGMLAPLIHIEETAGLEPDPMRRLAVLSDPGTVAELRLSRKQIAAFEIARSPEGQAGRLGYLHGFDNAMNALAVQATMMGRTISNAAISAAKDGAGQVFPIKAADVADRFDGPALGRFLKDAKDRWIASGFTLTKDDLIG